MMCNFLTDTLLSQTHTYIGKAFMNLPLDYHGFKHTHFGVANQCLEQRGVYECIIPI